MTAERRRGFKRGGLCARCGQGPPAEGVTTCEQCRPIANVQRAKYRHKLLSKGVCTRCREPNDRPGKHLCSACLKRSRKGISDLYHRRRKAGVCPFCGSATDGKRVLCPECRRKDGVNDRLVREKLRREIIQAYGSKCKCCGEAEPLFLQLDHIDNDGYKHRRSPTWKRTSDRLYPRVKKEGFPKDKYQLLCVNCNWGKHLNHGVCPHVERRRKTE